MRCDVFSPRTDLNQRLCTSTTDQGQMGGFRFYFAYCEAGFDAQYIRNFQVTWTKTEDTRESEQYRPRAEQQPAEDARRMDPSLQVRSPETQSAARVSCRKALSQIQEDPAGIKQGVSACRNTSGMTLCPK